MDNKICEHCASEVSGNYCSSCGQAKTVRAIDQHYLLDEVRSVLNLEKGFFYSVKQLTVQPGKSIQTFIHKDRSKLVKPLLFIIICSLIYTFLEQVFQFEEPYMAAGGFDVSVTTKLFEWIQSNYGYSNIIMAVFIALWLKVFFRKLNYNIYEISVLICFVMGIEMLIYALFGVAQSVVNRPILPLGAFCAIAYSSWAIGRFFNHRKIGSYIKAFLSYLLGMFSLFILAMIIGSIFDLILTT